jgi:hypothetical protein
MTDLDPNSGEYLDVKLKEAASWSDEELLFRLETSICHEYAWWINGHHAAGDCNKVRSLMFFSNVPFMEYMRRNRYMLTSKPTKPDFLYRYNLEPLYRIIDRLGRDYIVQFTSTPLRFDILFINKPAPTRSTILENILASYPVQANRLLTDAT